MNLDRRTGPQPSWQLAAYNLAGVVVGWAAWRGPVFMLREPGPFPGGLPPNPACGFHRTGLSRDLCRVRDGVRVDPVVAGRADDERLAPHSRHEDGPRGLARSRFPERLEAGDLVDCHRGAGLAELAFPSAEPGYQLLAGVEGRAGRGVTDDRPPVLPQDGPAESCYQVLLALAVLPGLVAGPRPVAGLDGGLAERPPGRCTLVGEIPTRRASSRLDQCVAPSGTSSIAFIGCVFDPGQVAHVRSAPDRDRLLVAALTGTATYHARQHEPGTAAAVAELRDLAGGRGDLLAEVAGITLGFYAGRPDEGRAQAMADLCRAAGADESLIPGWIEEGRHRAEAAQRPPFSGGVRP